MYDKTSIFLAVKSQIVIMISCIFLDKLVYVRCWLELDDVVLELGQEHLPLRVREMYELPGHLDLAVDLALENHVEKVALAVIIEHSVVLGHYQMLHDLAYLLEACLILDH